ncbi:MAG: hypothetical protein F6K53_17040 [Moorea sp. SIO4A1]|nr:hypothetical protein [Moorena sp. SIO4A1]
MIKVSYQRTAISATRTLLEVLSAISYQRQSLCHESWIFPRLSILITLELLNSIVLDLF